jgi:hypothetical protein
MVRERSNIGKSNSFSKVSEPLILAPEEFLNYFRKDNQCDLTPSC